MHDLPPNRFCNLVRKILHVFRLGSIVFTEAVYDSDKTSLGAGTRPRPVGFLNECLDGGEHMSFIPETGVSYAETRLTGRSVRRAQNKGR